MQTAKTRLIVVEDNLIVATDIAKHLRKTGYDVLDIFPRGDLALEAVARLLPDLLLVDINLRGTMDGIELAHQVKRLSSAPGIIYLTANNDNPTYFRAKETRPHAFLSKPFRKLDLIRTVDLAVQRMHQRRHLRSQEPSSRVGSAHLVRDRIFIRDKEHLVKLCLEDILYIEAGRNYCTVTTNEKQHLVTLPLKAFEQRLNAPHFLRVHRSFVVNLTKIDQLDERGEYLVVGQKSLSIGPSYKKELLSRLTLI